MQARETTAWPPNQLSPELQAAPPQVQLFYYEILFLLSVKSLASISRLDKQTPLKGASLP